MDINILFKLTVQLFEISLFFMFIEAFLELKKKNQIFIFLLGGAATVMFTFGKNFDVYRGLITEGNDYHVFAYAAVFLLLSLPYSGDFISKIFITLVFTILSYGIENIVVYSLCLFLHIEALAITYGMVILISSAGCIIKLFILNLLSPVKKDNTFVQNFSANTIFLIIPIMSMGIIFCINKLSFLMSSINAVFILIILFGITAINLAVFYLIGYMNKIAMERVNANLLRQEIECSQELYERIAEEQSELRNIKHDLKNRLSGIYGMLIRDNYEAALKEIGRIISDVDSKKEIRYSENYLMDFILNYKLKQKEAENLKIKTDIRLPRELDIESGDFGVLAGNLLDNAIEACQYVEKERAYISIRACLKMNVFILEIENSRNPGAPQNLRKADKINHGRGIHNVKKLVEKYNGNMVMEDTFETIYRVEISLLL